MHFAASTRPARSASHKTKLVPSTRDVAVDVEEVAWGADEVEVEVVGSWSPSAVGVSGVERERVAIMRHWLSMSIFHVGAEMSDMPAWLAAPNCRKCSASGKERKTVRTDVLFLSSSAEAFGTFLNSRCARSEKAILINILFSTSSDRSNSGSTYASAARRHLNSFER